LEFVLNGHRTDWERRGARTVAQLRSTIADWASERGEAVVEARLDGSRLDAMDGACELSVGRQTRLEVVTRRLDELLAEALDEAEAYLPRLVSGFRQVADLAISGERAECSHLLEACFEGLEWVLKLLAGADALLRKDGRVPTLAGKPIASLLGEIREHLAEVSDSLEADDPARFTDVIRYDVCRSIEEWHRGLKAFKAGVHVAH